uniref:Ig-like domain-containing protein n=1 Tax=Panagrellus redivivus TaxID=6233 RepID=A0A7E4UXK3_PANRE
MSTILIDYDGQRKTFEAPTPPIPWPKVIEIDVGRAPTVDVFFKSQPQVSEFRVKTFKFKTQKNRKVTIIVDVDASNTISAKLMTLEGGDAEMLLFIGSNGQYGVCARADGFSMMPDSIEGYSPSDLFDATVAQAATTLPPSSASAVYITDSANYTARRRMIQTLEDAGYKNVHCLESTSYLLSQALEIAKPMIQVGQFAGIIYDDVNVVQVVRKTDHGYNYVKNLVGLTNWHGPSHPIKEIISLNLQDLSDTEKNAIRKTYAPITVKFALLEGNCGLPYLWHEYDGTNNEYKVTMTTACEFRINWKDNETKVDVTKKLLPLKETIELNIGDVPEVNVFMTCEYDNPQESHVKQFKFKTKKNRKVSVSIAMDDERHPKIELVTL